MPSGRLAPEWRARREVFAQLAQLLYGAAEGRIAVVALDDPETLHPVVDMEGAAQAAALRRRAGWYHVDDDNGFNHELLTLPVRTALMDLASELEKRASGQTLAPGGIAFVDERGLSLAGVDDPGEGKRKVKSQPVDKRQMSMMFDEDGDA